MNKTNSKSMVLFFGLFFQILSINPLHAKCDIADDDAKMMLSRLQLESLCSSSLSIHTCQQALSGVVSTEKIDLDLQPKNLTCSSTQNSLLNGASTVLIKNVGQALTEKSSQQLNLKRINSFEEFSEHVRLHKERVKDLGMEILKRHPEEFKGVDSKMLERMLDAHDLAKVKPEALASDGRPFYRNLYDYWGKKMPQPLIDSLNVTDKKFMSEAFERQGLTNNEELKEKIRRIERIADTVDRGMSPESPEEFGRAMSRGSEFMKDPKDKALAEALEKDYGKIVSQHKYRGLSPLQVAKKANYYFIKEEFQKIGVRYSSAELSVRAMAHGIMAGSKQIPSKLIRMFTSESFFKLMRAADVPLLFFSEIKNTACSEIGYHDWVQDPHCKPAVGLTPRAIDFLKEDWAIQKFHLDYDNHTCGLLKKNYENSILAPKILNCGPHSLDMMGEDGTKLGVKFDSKGALKEVQLTNTGFFKGIKDIGATTFASFGENGNVEKVCYNKNGVLKTNTCERAESTAGQNALAYVHAFNYQIQKAIHCCRPQNSLVEIKCQN